MRELFQGGIRKIRISLLQLRLYYHWDRFDFFYLWNPRYHYHFKKAKQIEEILKGLK